MTSPEAARFLRISLSKLYKMTMNNKIPVTRIGKKLLFTEENLIDFIRKSEIENSNIELNQFDLLKLPNVA
jgi:excisionase family DNA binding protein